MSKLTINLGCGEGFYGERMCDRWNLEEKNINKD